MDRVIRRTGWDKDSTTDNGNRFLTANGYMGIRGTLPEYGRNELAAINLAGLYHKVGNGWRESLNAPNPLYVLHRVDGVACTPGVMPYASHEQALDITRGLHTRSTVFDLCVLRDERFCSMDNPHLLCLRSELTGIRGAADTDARTDSDIWEIYGPHYNHVESGADKGVIWVLAQTDTGQQVAVARRGTLAEDAESRVYTCCAAIYTSLDCQNPLAAAIRALDDADYDILRRAHTAAWAALWQCAEVSIDGDPFAEEALNYSLYHLLSIAPRHAASLSVPARGLSGQTYKGAVFWDTEMFMLDFYLAVQPQAARACVRYRIDTLQGALDKAAEYGYRGAFYAWESQEGGFDACSDYNVTDVFTGRPVRTYFRDRQYHITAAVVYGLMKYTRWTKDMSLLLDGGYEVLAQSARFYLSLLWQKPGSRTYQILGAVGPDEYHEKVDNNAYTNEMARWTLLTAAEVLAEMKGSHPAAYAALEQKIGFERELPLYKRASARLKEKKPGKDGLIEQFDGYFALEDVSVDTVRGRLMDPREYWGGANGVAAHTRVIKQADVIAMLYMLRGRYAGKTTRANYDYYEPRTEHGSSLSACMYALAACMMERPDAAYPLFMKSAAADLAGGGKQWAGLVYIGGTHPAAAGGAYMTFLYGFLGLEIRQGLPVLHPRLPEGWKSASCKIQLGGFEYTLKAKADGSRTAIKAPL
jgi:nigerose phosphorylase